MNSKQTSFLATCIRLPGLRAKQDTLNANDFLDSEDFLLFFLKQVAMLDLPGFRFEPLQYYSVGRWGFTVDARVNGNRELLLLAVKEKEGYVEALAGLICAANGLIRKYRPEQQAPRGFTNRLRRLLFYMPAPSDLHLVEAGGEYYVGLLPCNLETLLRLEDIRLRDLIPQRPYPFRTFSYQDPGRAAETLLVDSWGDADASLLSDFTGLKLAKDGAWHITDQQGKQQELDWGDNYRSVLKGINAIVKGRGARLHLQAYPWDQDLVFFISREEEERYKPTYTAKSANLRETEKKQLKLELTEAYIRLNPGDTEALAEHSTRHGELGNHKKALALTEEYLLIAPQNFTLQNNQLIAYVHLQRYPEAIEAGLKALALKPGSAQTHYFLGVAYTWTGDYEKATAVLEFCISNAPEEPFHWFAYAYLLYRQGDYEQAVEYYHKAIRTSVNFQVKQSCQSSAWFNIACIHSLQHRIEEARTAFIEALKLDPGYREDLFKDEELDHLRQAVDAEAMYREAGL